MRELDMVTLDRVKHIDVEADLAIWQRYARAQGVHPAIRAYLNICPDHFYRITDTDRGQFFVTARGWEDLSLMLLAYEEDGIEVSADWLMQYLQYDEIARSFSLFYDLFRSTANGASDAAGLSLAQRLLGEPDALAVRSATECLALASMLLHPIDLEATRIMEARRRLQRRRELASLLASAGQPDEASARAFLQQKRKALEVKAAHRTIKPEEELRESSALGRLEGDIVNWLKQPVDERSDFLTFEEGRLQSEGADLTSAAEAAAHAVEEAYQVLERCPNGHSALLYLTNDLAASEACADLLAAHPSPAFEKYRLEIE